jgi:hypothetical protein
MDADPATGQEHWTPGLRIHAAADEPVLDAARAAQLSDAGCQQSGDRAADDWKMDMVRGIYVIARRQPLLTSDDLWAELGAAAVQRCNPSALGGVFRSAARDGLIRLTGDRLESRRPAHHRRPLRVWQSLIFRDGTKQIADTLLTDR